MRQLEVWLSGRQVGSLVRTDQGLTRWIPEPKWEADRQIPHLGLCFLRQTGPRMAGTGLPPWFENLLPESGSALRHRLCIMFGIRENDGLGLLHALGRDLPGAVEVRGPEAGFPEPGQDAQMAGLGGERPFRFSLAGMQLKLSMQAQGDRLALTGSGAGHRYIVKLPGDRYPELPLVEATTMTWARHAGHEVPEHFLVDVGQLDGLPLSWRESAKTAFVIRRFDRRSDGTKIHHEDFCQALELLPQHKYGKTGTSRVSYDALLRLVVDACGENWGQIFAHRLGFVIACGNDDAHLKNWSLEWGSAARPSLSPCYDLVSTITWKNHGWEQHGGPTLALSLGRVGKFANIDPAALMRLNERTGFSWASEAVMEGARRARQAWGTMEGSCPPYLRDILQFHWSQVPILRSIGPLAT